VYLGGTTANEKFGVCLVSSALALPCGSVVSLVLLMALCSLRTRLATTWRTQRRSFTSVSEASQKKLLSQDDWTAFQLERAERSTLS
jgi:cell division protein FtsL